jgi:hypothetical protein
MRITTLISKNSRRSPGLEAHKARIELFAFASQSALWYTLTGFENSVVSALYRISIREESLSVSRSAFGVLPNMSIEVA